MFNNENDEKREGEEIAWKLFSIRLYWREGKKGEGGE